MTLILSLVASGALQAAGQSASSLRPVTVFAEGDSSVIPKFINVCRHMGPERGLENLIPHAINRSCDITGFSNGQGAFALCG